LLIICIITLLIVAETMPCECCGCGCWSVRHSHSWEPADGSDCSFNPGGAATLPPPDRMSVTCQHPDLVLWKGGGSGRITSCGGWDLCPFSQCIRVPRHFGGACGNCKWCDYAARCSILDANQNDEEQSSTPSAPPPLQLVCSPELLASGSLWLISPGFNPG
jgi:hypothetical protein